MKNRLRILMMVGCAWQAWAQSQSNPVPSINLPLVPVSVAPGGPGFTLTVNGTGFVPSSTVYWNGSPLATTYVSGVQVTAQVPAQNVAAPGSGGITVVNPGAKGSASSSVVYLPVNVPSTSVALVAQLPSPFGVCGSFPVAADFNGDGILDLVAVRPDGAIGCIALGIGDGTFQGIQYFPISSDGNSFPNWVAIGDFNGDGKTDLAITNYHYLKPWTAAHQVAIVLGNGDGTFQPPQEYAEVPPQLLTNFSDLVVVGDFNNDGSLDLAVSHPLGGIAGMSVFLGNGDGTLQPPMAMSTAYADSLVAVDLNGDGNLDLVTDHETMLGNGDGTFQAPIPISAGTYPSAVAAADLNGDGKLDLVIANRCGNDINCYSEGTVSVLLGNGDGTFQPKVDYNAGYGPESLAAVDINDDGKLDLLVVSRCGQTSPQFCVIDWNNVAVLLGNGDGTFQPEFFPDYASQHKVTAPFPLTVADANGDGRLDIAAAGVLLQTTLGVSNQAPVFGSQYVGSGSSAQPSTLTNVATAGTVTLSRTQVTGANPADFSFTTTCPAGLPPTQQCQINTVFTPTAAGTRTAMVTITDSAAGSPHTISLSGTGVAAPAVTFSPASLTFASQVAGTVSAPQAVTLNNSGSAALTLSGITSSWAFPQHNSCPASLAVGASCTIRVAFGPKSGGPLSGTVSVSTNAAGSPQTIGLAGTGVVLTVTPGSVSFGSQAKGTSSGAQVVTVTNVTASTAAMGSVRIVGSNNRSFSETSTCGASLAAGASCQISVTFTPQVKGALAATLQVPANGATFSATLAGTGK
jgi:FG-GAP-like repeat/Abnormal spindle-like microcephaly-assoc'd, ASPM-SPD-2-Hydin